MARSQCSDAATASNKTVRGGIVLNGCFNSQFVENQCNNNGVPSEGFSGADASAQFAPGIRIRGRGLVLKDNELKDNLKGPTEPWPDPYEKITITPDPSTDAAGKGGEEPAGEGGTGDSGSTGDQPGGQEPEGGQGDRQEKKSIFKRFIGWFKGLFGK